MSINKGNAVGLPFCFLGAFSSAAFSFKSLLCPVICGSTQQQFWKMSYNSQEFIRELIELYRSFPCLWLVKSPDYCNRNKKREAYAKLIALFQQHDPSEKVDETMVRKKIQGLRTVFKKELNKIERSKRSGCGTDDIYVPSLWYFNLMDFTRNQELPRASVCSFGPTNTEALTDAIDEDDCSQVETLSSGDIPGVAESRGEANVDENSPSTEQQPQRQRNIRRKAATPSSSEQLISLASRFLERPSNTGMDFFAKMTADRLQKLDQSQRSRAERLILETLSRAAAGNLEETTSLTPPTRLDRGPGPQPLWPQMPDTLHSTPVRRMGPPGNILGHPTPECSFMPQSFLDHLNSTNNHYET
ncbi:uncharacterized protein ACNLHF_012507 [Anomaloglossus baeobatrachus]|uniref:uncharacterized protein LOC142243251 n=1 Tax=Anomaloglossus baeobatrachus TaxID=238106 RepID=UPI003F4FCA5E